MRELKIRSFVLERKDLILAAATLSSIAIMIAWIYLFRIEIPAFTARYELHQEILSGTAGSPYRYRILIPYLAESLIWLGNIGGLSTKISFYLAYFIINVISISLFLLITYTFFSCFYSTKTSLIGALFIGGLIHIGMQDHYYQPWSITEGVFFVSALLLLQKGRVKLLWLLTLFATLNRETGLLIPALIFFSQLHKAQLRLNLSEYLGVLYASFTWLTVFLGLRFVLGNAEHVIGLSDLMHMNLNHQQLAKAFLNGFLLLGAWWIILLYAFWSGKIAPELAGYWRIAWVYVPLVLIFGVWAEVRLLIPLYPLAIATCLAVFEDALSDQPHGA